MSRGVNKVILIGRLGNDPEVKYMPSGGAVTNISVATSEQWKDKDTAQPQERTEWHRVVMFNRLGEIAGEYLKKGSNVYLEGSLRTRKWQGQDGQDRYTTEIVASEMQMLDGKGDAPSQSSPARNNNLSGAGVAGLIHEPNNPYQGLGDKPGNQKMLQNQPPAGFDNFDDDIPF